MSLALVSTPALSATPVQAPPAEYAAYFAAVREADTITDPLQRCLAYPDLPANTWAPRIAKARCMMFLTPPRYMLDDIENKLTQANGAAMLDADFNALLLAHYKTPALREQISNAFQVFHDRDHDRAEHIARAWLSAAPDSPFAHTALGRVLEVRGWAARGTKFAKDTPAEDLQKMGTYFADAAKEYAAAMQASPKLLPACLGLMAIGRQSSDEIQAYATKMCLEADPASFSVVDEMMTAAEPRWGGSDAAMQAVSAYAKSKIAKNPVLELFAFNDQLYEIERMDDLDAQAIAVLEPAAHKVPNAGFFRFVGGAYLRNNDNWRALVYLSQALRFSPSYAQESRFRALALRRLGENQWARADAERAVALAPDKGLALLQLGNILRKIDGPSAATPYFKRAITDQETREEAYNNYCGALLDAKQFDEAQKCIDDLLAIYPKNPEGWRQRLYLIGFDAPGSKQAMERFIALNDPKRWSYHTEAVKAVRLVKAGMEGTASPSELFDARALRAKALERSVLGRPYFEILKSSKNNQLESAVAACQPAIKAIQNLQFVAVMDIQADGSLKNIDVRPNNAWTSCMAKHAQTTWKLPPPPKLADALSFPLIYEVNVN